MKKESKTRTPSWTEIFGIRSLHTGDMIATGVLIVTFGGRKFICESVELLPFTQTIIMCVQIPGKMRHIMLGCKLPKLPYNIPDQHLYRLSSISNTILRSGYSKAELTFKITI